MSKYHMVISWSEEDQVFVAEVPDLEGCKAHGYYYSDAAVNAHEAISLWLEVAKEFGKTIPEPTTDFVAM